MIHRCMDPHRWHPHRCDEACGAGCEGLRPEQLLHEGSDRSNRSGDMGSHSQPGLFGVFRGTENTRLFLSAGFIIGIG